MPRSAAALMGEGSVLTGVRRVSSGRFAARGLSLLLGAALILWGCADPPVPADVARLPDYASLDPLDDPRRLSQTDLNKGPGSQELGASKLLREVGAIELLEGYIINIPPSAQFIARWEANKAAVSTFDSYADAGAGDKIIGVFEARVLGSAQGAMSTLPEIDGAAVLHEAFYGVLEQCGRASAWPDVELFVMGGGRGYDVEPHLIEPTFGLTYFEYQQLRHQCARYAATYPTLDPVVRDKLLAPQRGHYAQAILDSLDNELPLVEVPPRYQDEIDDLRANGW